MVQVRAEKAGHRNSVMKTKRASINPVLLSQRIREGAGYQDRNLLGNNRFTPEEHHSRHSSQDPKKVLQFQTVVRFSIPMGRHQKKPHGQDFYYHSKVTRRHTSVNSLDAVWMHQCLKAHTLTHTCTQSQEDLHGGLV